MKTSIIYWVSIFLLTVLGACSSHPSLVVKELQCEKLVNPLAIDHTKPYLSWQLEAKDNGLCQSAYQILAVTDEDLLTEEKADLWNSGKVESSESAWVLYQGNELASKQFVYWKVRVWDGNDKASDWSETACFGIGLLHPSDWKASYIGSDTLSGKPQSPLLWKRFQWNQKGTKVFLHVNSLGYHEVYLNGKKVGDAVLAPALSAITASLVHTDYSGESFFACSDKDLNAIHDMIQYTLRCLTLGGYMVDCPQIERLGYGGDGNASTPTVQTMFNLSPLYMNWMQAWADCMREDGSMPHTAPNPYAAGGGPFWCGFIITASWQTYLNYGDRRLLDRYYPYMQQWLEYVAHYTVDGLLKKWPDTSYRNWYLGDWATPVGIDQTNPLSVDLVDNCYIAVCYQTMSKIAPLLNKTDESLGYKAKYDALTKRIQETFYDVKGNTYASGTQIDLVPMLAGVTPDNLKETVLKTLYEVTANRFQGHLATGLVGIPVLTEWAVKNGQAEWMYQMLKKRDYPGYLYMLDNGATTTWEHWNGERSHIHNCYNGIGAWFYHALAGIMPDESQPGYKHIWIKPQVVNDISWVQASKDTPYGLLKVRWEKKEASFVLDVQIPVGASASVALPFPAESVCVNGQPSPGKEVLELESGSYQVECSR